MIKFRLPNLRLDKEPNLREKLLFSAAMVGMLFFFSNAFWDAHLGAIRQMQTELRSITSQIDATKKLIEATQQQLSKQEAEPKVQLKMDPRLKALIDRRVIDVTGEINSTADLLGGRQMAGRLKITKVAIGERVEKTAYSIIPIAVELSGPYTGVQSYLEAINSMDRPLVVRSFHMESQRDTPGELSAKLDVDLYIVKR